MENVINKVIQEVKPEEVYDLENVVRNFLDNIGNVYSYLVYANYKGEDMKSWSIQYNISQIGKFNTLSPKDITSHICDIIRDSYVNYQKMSIKYVIGYNQPPLELILRLYEPFIRSAAKKQHDKWKNLPYEDLCQDCRLVICMLYDKGYYIHKRLVEKCFNNLILMSLRKDMYKVNIISLDDTFNQLSGETELMIKDIIPDTRLLEKEYDDEEGELVTNFFDELKELIIDEIGERGFEQLLRNYGNKTTDDWSRGVVRKLKEKFAREGVYELLKKKYN